MKLPKTKETQTYLKKVPTSIGVFTVHFPCAVFNPQDNLNKIPEALANFDFRQCPPNADDEEVRLTADWNARHLQQALNKACCYGIANPQAGIDVLYAMREVVVS